MTRENSTNEVLIKNPPLDSAAAPAISILGENEVIYAPRRNNIVLTSEEPGGFSDIELSLFGNG